MKKALVRFHTEWMWQFFLAETDKQGRFSFQDLPAKGWDMSPWGSGKHGDGRYKITVSHPNVSIPEYEVQLEPGDEVTDFIINAFSDGTLVKCRVIDSDTNMPIAGARIQGTNAIGRINGYSDAKGIFTFRAEPGPTTLFSLSPPDGVYTLDDRNIKELTFKAAGKEMEVVLKAPAIGGQLKNVTGHVFDNNGIGQPNAVLYVQADKHFNTSTAGSYIRATGTDSNGQFKLKEVPAGLNLLVYVETKDRSSAGTSIFEISADTDEAVTIEVALEPTQSCDLVLKDENGDPICDTSLYIRPVVGDQNVWGGYGRTVRTDSTGRLRTTGIIQGLEYYFQDTKFQQSDLPHEQREKLFEGKFTLIPL